VVGPEREDIKIYPNVGHAFMNPNNKGGYDAGSAADEWDRINAFFAKELKGK
jgi:dienelactone hydrolase